jgi:nicotinamide mononucleotide transporter
VYSFFNQVYTNLLATSWLEFVAVIFGILSVWLIRSENIWGYPTGIINTVLFTYLCFVNFGLYAEGSLNVYYTVMSIYGWYAWKKNNASNNLVISKSNKKDWQWAILFFVGSLIFLYIILKTKSNSTVPFFDSLSSACAYTAMWLMARKKLENWLWWIATNLLSMPLFYIKGAAFTSVQYLVFLILAIAGYIHWKKILQKQTA